MIVVSFGTAHSGLGFLVTERKRQMGTNRCNHRRTLMAEQLERRELLAANLACPVPVLPDAPQGETTLVQSQPSTAAASGVDTPLNQRDRTSEDSDTGLGRQKRPRDRDAEEVAASTEATVLTSQPSASTQAAAQVSAQQGGQILSAQSLSQEEIDQLLFIREEEKLARDVYLALADKWDAPIFTNIAQSEQQHMDAVGQLIEKYGLEDPITDDTQGVFTNDTLRDLYNDLVSSGDVDLGYVAPGLVIEGGGTSQLAAYKVGAFIEEFDIIDIQHAIAETSHSDVANVYENLVRGSRNHLRSFVEQIEATGEDYEPVVMTGTDPVTGEDLDALYLEIITGDQETANGRGGGQQRAGGHAPRTNSEPTPSAADELFAGYGRRSGRTR